MLTILSALVVLACSTNAPSPTVCETEPADSPPALVVGPVTVIAAPEDNPPNPTAPVRRMPLYAARLEDHATVRITSLVDRPTVVYVRWWWHGWRAWDQQWSVPPRGTITAFPDCFYGGLYRIELVGQGWAWTHDYGPQIPFCY